jgi:hypothetical protein
LTQLPLRRVAFDSVFSERQTIIALFQGASSNRPHRWHRRRCIGASHLNLTPRIGAPPSNQQSYTCGSFLAPSCQESI